MYTPIEKASHAEIYSLSRSRPSARGGPHQPGRSRQALIEDLNHSRQIFLDAIADVKTAAQWNYKPAPDRWSVGEVAEHVVLALGHSARDTFEMLHQRGVYMEPKPFSIGFRIEHPQSLIDRARFGQSHKELGAAEYRLVHHASNGRGVYSFCMCPGGTVVAAPSEMGRVATNGMSQ